MYGTIQLVRQLEFQDDKTDLDPFIHKVGWRFFSLHEEIPVYKNSGLLRTSHYHSYTVSQAVWKN